ncbi:secretin receptor, partial [Biomphalaria glabrata]
RLHCARNIIHMNMFLAFGLRAVFSLLKNILLVNDLGFVNDVNQTGSDFTFVESGTHWECKLFFTLFYYIIFASVMWLFNEGLYLQLILSVAVFSDKTRMEWFLLLGWGTPFCFLLPWVLCRIHLDDML